MTRGSGSVQLATSGFVTVQELVRKHRQGLNLRAEAWLKAQQNMSRTTLDLLDACNLLCPGSRPLLCAQELLRQQYPSEDVLYSAILQLLCDSEKPAGA